MKRSRTKIPAALGRRVRQQARHRRGYCLCSEVLIGMRMEIEHFIPLALNGQTLEENLWLSCRRCNGFKGLLIQAIDPETQESAPLFNPRQQNWYEHFVWSEDGSEFIGLTAAGRATVNALNLNYPIAVMARKLWVSVGWWPPTD